MDQERTRPQSSPDLSAQRLNFVHSLRTRRASPDAPLQKLMTEVNSFPPEAKDYLSFLTNIFLEKDVYEKIMAKPNSTERILIRLLNAGLSLQQAQSTLDYFSSTHSTATSGNPNSDLPNSSDK